MFVFGLGKMRIDGITQPNLLHINVGTGKDVMIKELAETLREVVGYKGKIVFDHSKPDGAPRKLMDVSLLTHLGFISKTDLRSGLLRTYHAFRQIIFQRVTN